MYHTEPEIVPMKNRGTITPSLIFKKSRIQVYNYFIFIQSGGVAERHFASFALVKFEFEEVKTEL